MPTRDVHIRIALPRFTRRHSLIAIALLLTISAIINAATPLNLYIPQKNDPLKSSNIAQNFSDIQTAVDALQNQAPALQLHVVDGNVDLGLFLSPAYPDYWFYSSALKVPFSTETKLVWYTGANCTGNTSIGEAPTYPNEEANSSTGTIFQVTGVLQNVSLASYMASPGNCVAFPTMNGSSPAKDTKVPNIAIDPAKLAIQLM